jgi:hypothetical protein
MKNPNRLIGNSAPFNQPGLKRDVEKYFAEKYDIALDNETFSVRSWGHSYGVAFYNGAVDVEIVSDYCSELREHLTNASVDGPLVNDSRDVSLIVKYNE